MVLARCKGQCPVGTAPLDGAPAGSEGRGTGPDAERLEIRYTRMDGDWLEIAEIELSALWGNASTGGCLTSPP